MLAYMEGTASSDNARADGLYKVSTKEENVSVEHRLSGTENLSVHSLTGYASGILFTSPLYHDIKL